MEWENFSREDLIEKANALSQQMAELQLAAESREIAEKMLRDSEEKYRILVESAPMAVFVIRDGRVAFFNGKLEELTGKNAVELENCNFASFVHPEDVSRVADVIKFIPTDNALPARFFFDDNAQSSHSFRIIRADKTMRWVELETVIIMWEQKPATLNFIIDITDKRYSAELLELKNSQQKKFLDLARHLISSMDIFEVLSRIGGGAIEMLSASGCAVYLLRDDNETLEPVVAILPPFEEVILQNPIFASQNFLGMAIKSRKVIAFNNPKIQLIGQLIDDIPHPESERILAAPLLANDVVLGAMWVSRLDGMDFTEEEKSFAESFVSYASSALKNAQIQQKLQDQLQFHMEMDSQFETQQKRLENLVRDRSDELVRTNELLRMEISERKKAESELVRTNSIIKKTLDHVIRILVKTVEIRDPFTAGHQERVGALAEAIAKKMGLSKERIEAVKTASIVHDIGKIYIPSEILSNPGKLHSAELTLIKLHSERGYEILKNVEFPLPIAEFVYQHHERINGSGYPNGLTGDQMHLESKIIAVADVIEAMAYSRPYREALGISFALDEIASSAGKLYDADVVRACLELFNEDGFQLPENTQYAA